MHPFIKLDLKRQSSASTYVIRLFSFAASGANSESFSFTKGGNTRIFFGDGTSSTASGVVSKTYDTSSVPAGARFLVTTTDPTNQNLHTASLYLFNGLDTGNGSTSIKNLNGLEFYWDAVTKTTNTLQLQNLGIDQPMPTWSTTDYTTFNLKGNSIPGAFPSNITAKNLFIQGNRFTGQLPSLSSNTVKYQVQSNAFEGSIHDISGNTQIQSYLAYGQDDGNNYNSKVMLTGEIPNLSGCTALTFYHVGAGEPWNRGFRNNFSLASDFDVTNNLSKFYATNCQLHSTEVDKILNVFANTSTISPSIIDLSGSNGAATSAGLADRDTLVASGWTVHLPFGN